MFLRIENSGKYKYLQVVRNRRENGKVKQTVLTTLGRLDQLNDDAKEEERIEVA